MKPSWMHTVCIVSGGTWYPHDVICDVSLDHVVKVISARFLHYKGTIFLFPCTVILSKTSSMSICISKHFSSFPPLAV